MHVRQTFSWITPILLENRKHWELLFHFSIGLYIDSFRWLKNIYYLIENYVLSVARSLSFYLSLSSRSLCAIKSRMVFVFVARVVRAPASIYGMAKCYCFWYKLSQMSMYQLIYAARRGIIIISCSHRTSSHMGEWESEHEREKEWKKRERER